MKAIIEIKKNSVLSSICFKSGNKTIDWSQLTRKEQITILNGMISFNKLFSRFIKEEGKE
jgi:hypothetical protein